METFEEDREKIHELIGLPYKKRGHYHDIKKLGKSNYSTQDWTTKLFEDVMPETKEKLRAIYKYDFEMFDYNPFLY